MNTKAFLPLDCRQLALDLLKADSEDDVVGILGANGLWDDRSLWRLYGDKEGNFAQAGNQQALPEAALVEKIVNSCDSRLMLECLRRGIDPVSRQAPISVRDAVAMFFENRRADEGQAGTLVEWGSEKRTKEAHHITIAATGGRPTRGHKAKNMCLTISDQAEGQTPARVPETILSLNAKNKQRIRFVQGKFNMGGSGALRFCGSMGLQLVISRRHPELVAREQKADPKDELWSVTVVRREEPSNVNGEPVHSEFTYLAPIGAAENPRQGTLLTFPSKSMPLMPDRDEAYVREVSWGTTLKLYEYQTKVGQSSVLMRDGLLYSLERLLPEIALPLRIHECRGYSGHAGSHETTIAGLVVRLEDGKGDNLEPGFPLSVSFQAAGLRMTARIYAFREGAAATYLSDEGVIFTINGQAHGYLPKSIFARPKRVNLPRLKDSLLVLVDCSSLSAKQREDLFMSSRDRLSKSQLRDEIEAEIEDLLKSSNDLATLQNKRREIDVNEKLSEDKPLEDVLKRILTSSPTLKSLFLQGHRLARPFAGGAGQGEGNGKGAHQGDRHFSGKRHPTYFRAADRTQGTVLSRNWEEGRRMRVKFETDVENGYFDRPTDRGRFDLELVEASGEFDISRFNISLEDGEAHLSMAFPDGLAVGDQFVIQASVYDTTLPEPLVTLINVKVISPHEHKSGTRKSASAKHGGFGELDTSPQGITLPIPIAVHENDPNWVRQGFSLTTACHVISDPRMIDGKEVLEHVFYINVDNAALKTEMKYSKQDSKLLEAKFKYANVLLGIAMLHDAENSGRAQQNGADSDAGGSESRNHETVQDSIRRMSAAVAPVLIPIIDQLSGLTDDQFTAASDLGEDL